MSLRVLTVDDCAAVRRIMKVILEIGGHHPILAEDVPSACAILRVQRPDVILTDYAMPGLTGYDLVREVRADADFDPVPIFVVSSEDAPDILNRMEAAGANGWFPKPVCAASLLTMLDAIAASRPADRPAAPARREGPLSLAG